MKSPVLTTSDNFLTDIENFLAKANEKICAAAGGKLPDKECGATEPIGKDFLLLTPRLHEILSFKNKPKIIKYSKKIECRNYVKIKKDIFLQNSFKLNHHVSSKTRRCIL